MAEQAVRCALLKAQLALLHTLTSWLDGKSCETVIRILTRAKRIISTKDHYLDLYTREEQEEFRLLRENFHAEILQVSDGLFAWRNYLLPKNYFDLEVLYYRHGLPTLRHPELAKGKAVIDAGGRIGDSVLILPSLSPPPSTPLSPCPKTLSF